MPVRKGVGQSESTRIKQFVFEKASGHLVGAAVMAARNHARPCVVADMTAGRGYYPQTQLDGSPLILAKHVAFFRAHPKVGIGARFLCVEHNRHALAELQRHMSERYPDLPVEYFKDQKAALDTIPSDAYGLTYWDPNGYSSPRNGLNKELLASFGSTHDHMDILITRACLAGRRVMSAEHCKDNALPIDGYLRLTGKSRFYLLEYATHDWWTFGFASNWEKRPEGKLWFHPIESEEAQRLLRKHRLGTRPQIKQEETLWQ